MTKRTMRLDDLHEIKLEGGVAAGYRFVFKEYDNGNVVKAVTVPVDYYDAEFIAKKLWEMQENFKLRADNLADALRGVK